MALNQITDGLNQRFSFVWSAGYKHAAHEKKGILGTRQKDTGFLTWAGVPPKPAELPPLAVPVVHIIRL